MTTERSNTADSDSTPRFHHSMERNCTILGAMRIDPKGTRFGYPLLYVRKLVRVLNNYLSWDLNTVQEVLSVRPTQARKIVKALHAAGLSKRCRGRHLKTWTTTQSAQTLASATAAKPITRQTADRVCVQRKRRRNRRPRNCPSIFGFGEGQKAAHFETSFAYYRSVTSTRGVLFLPGRDPAQS